MPTQLLLETIGSLKEMLVPANVAAIQLSAAQSAYLWQDRQRMGVLKPLVLWAVFAKDIEVVGVGEEAALTLEPIAGSLLAETSRSSWSVLTRRKEGRCLRCGCRGRHDGWRLRTLHEAAMRRVGALVLV